jgi:hypothetical protein
MELSCDVGWCVLDAAPGVTLGVLHVHSIRCDAMGMPTHRESLQHFRVLKCAYGLALCCWSLPGQVSRLCQLAMPAR